MNQKAIEELAARTIVDARRAAEKYGRLKGFSLKSLQGAFRITVVVVKEVEAVGLREKLKGADKRELAVELLLQLVTLPWWLPKAAVRAVLPSVVDAVVDALKDRFE